MEDQNGTITGDQGTLDNQGNPLNDQQPDNGNLNSEGGNNTDKKVELDPKDYKNLIGQRDKNDTKAKTLEEEVGELRFQVASISAEKYKKEAIDNVAEKYPLADREILDLASSEEEAETIAKKLQSKAEQIEQDALKKLTTVNSQPPLDRETAQKNLDALKGSGNIAEVINIKSKMR